jgi:hypothetical protein
MSMLRSLAVLFSTAFVLSLPCLKADVVLFQDDSGNAEATIPAYYPIQSCSGASCLAIEAYPLTVTSDTIPGMPAFNQTSSVQGTVYIGDSAGYVSDKIVTELAPPSSCSPNPSCETEITDVTFNFTAGLDLGPTPFTCASVGGCALTSDGSVQDIGEITWGPGIFTPPALYGDTTTLEFQSVPEPASWIPLAVAGLAIILLSRRAHGSAQEL